MRTQTNLEAIVRDLDEMTQMDALDTEHQMAWACFGASVMAAANAATPAGAASPPTLLSPITTPAPVKLRIPVLTDLTFARSTSLEDLTDKTAGPAYDRRREVWRDFAIILDSMLGEMDIWQIIHATKKNLAAAGRSTDISVEEMSFILLTLIESGLVVI